MNLWITYAIAAVVLLSLELLYFRVADKYRIVDEPGERSALARIGNHLGPDTPFNSVRLRKMTCTQTYSGEKLRRACAKNLLENE